MTARWEGGEKEGLTIWCRHRAATDVEGVCGGVGAPRHAHKHQLLFTAVVMAH